MNNEEVRFVIEKKNYDALIKKYPGSKKIIDQAVEKAGKSFNSSPAWFETQGGKSFIPEIKEIIYFEDLEELRKKTKEEINTSRTTWKKLPSEKENPFKKLHYSTNHLTHYHEFSSLIGLYGRHYIPLIKTRWYQLHGGILQKIIRVGSLITDTRIHACYPLVTEGGKNELIYSIKSLVSRGIKKNATEYFKCSEPISFHQESLIGKRVERVITNPKFLSGETKSPKQIKTKIENRGHLNSDFIEFDECNQLITSNAPDFQQAREYLSKAENPIGRNMVEKRSVDDLEEETIAYNPKSTHSFYFQPFKKLPETFVLQGFGRRKLIPIGNISLFLNNPTEINYTNKLQFKTFSEKDYQETLIKHLELMRSKLISSEFFFTEKATQMLSECSMYLSSQAQLHSEKIANYSKVSKWTSISNLAKMSCILAGAEYSFVVDENHVSLAFMDLVELMQSTFDFIYERIYGDFDYGVTWGGADQRERQCLEYLYQEKAFTFENSIISISEFEGIVGEIFKVGESQSRTKIKNMKEKGLLDSSQRGRNDSAVWLKIKPDQHKNFIEGDKGIKGYTLYNNVFLAKNSTSTPLKPSSPLIPLDQEKAIDFEETGIKEALEE